MEPTREITRVEHWIAPCDRESRNAHRGGVLWFTGLSGAGKSTLALGLEERLFRQGFQVYVLDGDNVRQGLSADLGFSREDRRENIRRAGEVAALFADAGFVCLAAFISPYRADRATAREAVGERFHEVFVQADLATCERRDPKGLYRKARAGKLSNFTAVDDAYEPPESPALTIDTATNGVEWCVATLVDYVAAHFRLEDAQP